MTLTPEWRRRIDSWRKELRNHFYDPLGAIEMSGFTTRDQLAVEEALKGDFKATPPGTRWGANWEYGWFRGKLVLPVEAAGKRIVMRIDVGAESVIFVNDSLTGASDAHHTEVTASMHGIPGERYEVVVEGYAGHGPRVHDAGPTPPGRVTVPEPDATQATVGYSSFGVWQEDAYQLWIDVETLYHVRNSIDQDSLRVAEIDQGLREFTTVVDFEQGHAGLMESVRAGRERLRPLLDCVNGSTAPSMFSFGHAHIDLAWLWPLAETERKAARTLATQLALMEEYPEYRLLQSQPYIYRILKARYPRLYERVRKATMAGQLIPEGGAWVESDTNVPSGESLIRQLVHGKRFFEEELGVNNELLWLPDVFGYSGALPQIMRDCGIRYFSTAKIMWGYDASDPFPHNTFVWEGIDGSEVLVHLCNNYNSHTDPASVIQRWSERVQKDGISTRLLPFGWGDGGGGPTRDHLEYIRRLRDLEGAPRVRMCSPVDYFKDQEARGWPEVRYVGELYLQCHRGTLTSQARVKSDNRRCEFVLREAEIWGATARALGGYAYPRREIDEAWKKVLLNQFHDILPGSSIQRVYEDTRAAHDEVISIASEVASTAASVLTEKSRAVTIFNSLSWERAALVALPPGCSGAINSAGEVLPSQLIDNRTSVEVLVPSCGWTTLHLTDDRKAATVTESSSNPSPKCRLLENEVLLVEFNERGEITSIFDKEIGRELAAGPCNSLKMYRDVPSKWDAWDIDSMYPLTPVDLGDAESIDVVSTGPLVTKIHVKRQLNHSAMTQEISLRRGSRQVRFRTVIDWQESHKLLKVAFPVNIHASEAIHEIQFGHIRRPNHQSRPFDADRFEVANHKWSAITEENRGFAVLNDCKYGVNVLGNSINLTLLKAPLAPDMSADKGRHEFTYAFYAWNDSLADSGVVREAYELNCPVMTVPGAAGERALLSVDAPNVIIETVKPAEDGSEDIVVRMYDSKRMATSCTLSSSLPVAGAEETDMLENSRGELPCHNNRIALEFRAFEVKTLRLRLTASRF